jgi:O-antigen/teichoic acid export membrane protein
MGARSLAASIGGKAVQTFVTRIGVAVLGVLTGILIARLLGPQGKGVYSGVQTLLSIPIAVTGGAGAAITYLMTKERRTINDLFPALTGAFSLIMLLTLAACAAYAGVRGWTIEMVAFVLAMPPSILLSWQQPYYMAVDLVRRLNVQNAVVAFCTLAGTAVLCWWLGLGVVGALAAWLLVLYGCAAFILADMIRSGGRLHRRDLQKHTRDFLRVGSQSALNSGLGLFNYRVDSIVLIGMLGLPVFGIYSIAVSIGEMLFLIARSVNTAIGREVGVADPQRAANITALVVRSSTALCLLCAIPLALVAPPLVHAVYGSRFDDAALPLRLLLPGIVAFASAGTFASYFIFQLGRPSAVTIINVAMIAAQLAGCFALVPRFGLAGAAISSTVAYVAAGMVNTVLFCRMSSLPAAALWIPRRSDFQRMHQVAREILASRRVARATE